MNVTLNGVAILRDVSARVPENSCTMVVGPNGAGKTTLLQALLGETAYEGRIEIGTRGDGRPLRLGYVPQRLAFDRGMPLTVAELLAAPAQRRPLWLGVGRAMRDRAGGALETVGAAGLLDRPVGALSGGELQRVLVALALLNEPDLLVLDEPTAGMDVLGQQMFCELLEDLRSRHGFTQLMVSHDIATVSYHATHVICLNGQVIAEGPPQQVLTRENLLQVFGVHLGLANPDVLGCAAPPCAGQVDPG